MRSGGRDGGRKGTHIAKARFPEARTTPAWVELPLVVQGRRGSALNAACPDHSSASVQASFPAQLQLRREGVLVMGSRSEFESWKVSR